MKTIIATTALCLALSAPAFAGKPDRCEVIAVTAERIMFHRQEVADLTGILAFADTIPNEALRRLNRSLALDAYSRHRVCSLKARDEVARAYGDEILERCRNAH